MGDLAPPLRSVWPPRTPPDGLRSPPPPPVPHPPAGGDGPSIKYPLPTSPARAIKPRLIRSLTSLDWGGSLAPRSRPSLTAGSWSKTGRYSPPPFRLRLKGVGGAGGGLGDHVRLARSRCPVSCGQLHGAARSVQHRRLDVEVRAGRPRRGSGALVGVRPVEAHDDRHRRARSARERSGCRARPRRSA